MSKFEWKTTPILTRDPQRVMGRAQRNDGQWFYANVEIADGLSGVRLEYALEGATQAVLDSLNEYLRDDCTCGIYHSKATVVGRLDCPHHRGQPMTAVESLYSKDGRAGENV